MKFNRDKEYDKLKRQMLSNETNRRIRGQQAITSPYKERSEKMMGQLGCEDYDRYDDMSKLTLKITETLETNKIKWREYDENKVKELIRNQVVQELCRLEERKLVRRNQMVIDEKNKAKKMRERE